MRAVLLAAEIEGDGVYGTTTLQPAVGDAWRYRDLLYHYTYVHAGTPAGSLEVFQRIPSKSLSQSVLQLAPAATAAFHNVAREQDWMWSHNDLVIDVVHTQGNASNVGRFQMAFFGVFGGGGGI